MKKLLLATLIVTNIGAPALCMDPVVEKETVGTIISNRNSIKLLEIPIEDIVLYYKTANIKKDIEFLVEFIKGFEYKQPQLLNIMDSIPSFINVAIEVGCTDTASPSYQYTLGGFLLCNTHDQKYTQEAFNLIKLAADKGFLNAQMDIGMFYDDGIHVEKNEKESFRYYKLASLQFPGAYHHLIPKYEIGSGVEQDVLMAIGLTTIFRDQSMMEKYIELVDDPTTILDHNESSSEDQSTNMTENLEQEDILIENQLPILTGILNEKMIFKTKLHKPTGFKKESQNLEIPELSFLYNALSEYGSKINFIGESIIPKLNDRGFCISCLQPTELLRSNYKKDSEGEKTMFCMFVTDGAFYSFVGKLNAPIGYKLKQLLGQEKDEALKNLDLLENNLRVAKSTTLSLLSMYNISDGTNTLQIKQLDEELDLIPAVRESIKKSIDFIHDLLRYNLKDRNSLFIKVYCKNVINKGEE